MERKRVTLTETINATFPAPSTSRNPAFVPSLGRVENTTGDTCATGLGEGRKSSIRTAPHVSLLKCVAADCSKRPPTLVRVVYICKRFLNS